MKTLLHLLLLLTVWLAPDAGHAAAADSLDDCRRQQVVCHVTSRHARQQSQRDALRHETIGDQPRPVAVMADGQHSQRISGSRQQRITPVHGNRQHRTGGRLTLCHHPSFTPKHSYGGRRLPVSTPIRPGVACHYYVIALRHILR